MSIPPRILAISGSRRPGSLNVKLLNVAVAAARDAGGNVTVLQHDDFNLPIYDGELEEREGVPQSVMKLKEVFKGHDALMLACPEYNSSITPLLKNTIDWVSRPVPGEKPLECFTGKVAGLMAASPGWRGGLRGLVHVRDILGNIGVHVLPTEMTLMHADKAFGDDGSLKEEKNTNMAIGVARELVRCTASLRVTAQD